MRSAAATVMVTLVFLLGCKHPVRPQPQVNPQTEAERLLAQKHFKEARAHIGTLQTLRATLVRRESLAGGTLGAPDTIEYVGRVQPRALHMTWVDGPLKGRELVYVEGQNDGNAKVRLDGWRRGLGVMNLPPGGTLIMQNSRFPLDRVGFDTLLERIVNNYDLALAGGKMVAHDAGLEFLDGYNTRKLELTLNCDPRHKCDYSRMDVWFDQRGLPVRFAGYDLDGQPVEDYFWKTLTVNLPVTEQDFMLSSSGRDKPPK